MSRRYLKGVSAFAALALICNSAHAQGLSGGGSVSAANPTASLGLTAINGSASTYMRSDAAPALDVTISPTWSGAHQFNSSLKSGGHLTVLSGSAFEFGFAGQTVAIATNPTISAGCGTSPTVTGNNSTLAFQLTIGTSPGTTCTLAFPNSSNAPQHGYHCEADDITTTTIVVHQTSMPSTVSSVLTFYNFAGTATAPTASDKILVTCMAF